LGLLGYFKYGNFLLENFVLWCETFRVTYHPPELGIILPIGISFYTFASLSYTIDVYRKEIRYDWKFSDYALFVGFFPHLVAGPIVRANYLLPQIEQPQLPKANQIGWGFALVCFGLFAKVVMADSIFAPLVDSVYSHPERFSVIDTWIAALSFSGQIYYDFSGYSLCAIALAHLPFFLVTGLSIYPPWGQPPWGSANLLCSVHDHVAWWPLAWRIMDVCLVGRTPWNFSGYRKSDSGSFFSQCHPGTIEKRPYLLSSNIDLDSFQGCVTGPSHRHFPRPFKYFYNWLSEHA
jgi:hypothetical protein